MRAILSLSLAFIALLFCASPSLQAPAVLKSPACTQYCWNKAAEAQHCTNRDPLAENDCMCRTIGRTMFEQCNRICAQYHSATSPKGWQSCFASGKREITGNFQPESEDDVQVVDFASANKRTISADALVPDIAAEPMSQRHIDGPSTEQMRAPGVGWADLPPREIAPSSNADGISKSFAALDQGKNPTDCTDRCWDIAIEWIGCSLDGDAAARTKCICESTKWDIFENCNHLMCVRTGDFDGFSDDQMCKGFDRRLAVREAETATPAQAEQPSVYGASLSSSSTSGIVGSVDITAVPVTGSSIFSGILPPTSHISQSTMKPPAPYTKRQIIGQVPWKHDTTTAPEPPRPTHTKNPHGTEIITQGTINWCGVPGAACAIVAQASTVSEADLTTVTTVTSTVVSPPKRAADEPPPLISTLRTYGGIPGLKTIATLAPGLQTKRDADEPPPLITTLRTYGGISGLNTIATLAPGLQTQPIADDPPPSITFLRTYRDGGIEGLSVVATAAPGASPEPAQ